MSANTNTRPVLVVTGSRAWTDALRLWCHLDYLRRKFRFAELWHGGASGADCLAAAWARTNSVPAREFPADWRTHGKKAGILRSREMLLAAPPGSFLAAFASPSLACSRGTAFAVHEAKRLNLPVWLVAQGQEGHWACRPDEASLFVA